MEHAISDLQKKAAAWDAMPPLSPVALTVTVNTVDHDVAALQSSVRLLSRVVKKFLLG